MKVWAVNFSLDHLAQPPAKSSFQLAFGFFFFFAGETGRLLLTESRPLKATEEDAQEVIASLATAKGS